MLPLTALFDGIIKHATFSEVLLLLHFIKPGHSNLYQFLMFMQIIMWNIVNG